MVIARLNEIKHASYCMESVKFHIQSSIVQAPLEERKGNSIQNLKYDFIKYSFLIAHSFLRIPIQVPH